MVVDAQEEWLELTYRRRVAAMGVNVYETLNPGAVCRVTYYDTSGEEQVAWEGDDPTPVDAKFKLSPSKIRFGRAVETDRVRIYLDSPRVKGWNEIDAVGLIEALSEGFPEQEHWALDAKASSTFADEPRPETVAYQYEGPHTELKYDDGLAHCKRGTWDSEWQVMRFTRPKDKPCLEALRVLGTRGDYRPERTTVYVLDEDMKVLKEISTGSRIRDRGPVKWYAYQLESLEVPETFHVAFEFYGPKGRAISLATRRLAEGETGHSFLGEEGQDLKPLEVQGAASDWMIRAYLAEKPNEKAKENKEAHRQPFTR